MNNFKQLNIFPKLIVVVSGNNPMIKIYNILLFYKLFKNTIIFVFQFHWSSSIMHNFMNCFIVVLLDNL